MSARIIELRPHFSFNGRQDGWEIGEGDNLVVNRGSKEDAEKAWGVSVRRYQEAGYTVQAIAYDRDGTVVAHGTYHPDGTVVDHGGKAKATKGKVKATKPADVEGYVHAPAEVRIDSQGRPRFVILEGQYAGIAFLADEPGRVKRRVGETVDVRFVPDDQFARLVTTD